MCNYQTEVIQNHERTGTTGFIPGVKACLATHNVVEEKGLVRWMARGESGAPTDNGWQVMNHVGTFEHLNDISSWQTVDFNDPCTIEPVPIDIWDLSVSSGLQIVHDELGIRIVDTLTGRGVPIKNLYVPPSQRAG